MYGVFEKSSPNDEEKETEVFVLKSTHFTILDSLQFMHSHHSLASQYYRDFICKCYQSHNILTLSKKKRKKKDNMIALKHTFIIIIRIAITYYKDYLD